LVSTLWVHYALLNC